MFSIVYCSNKCKILIKTSKYQFSIHYNRKEKHGRMDGWIRFDDILNMQIAAMFCFNVCIILKSTKTIKRIKVWIGLSSVLRPGQHIICYMEEMVMAY